MYYWTARFTNMTRKISPGIIENAAIVPSIYHNLTNYYLGRVGQGPNRLVLRYQMVQDLSPSVHPSKFEPPSPGSPGSNILGVLRLLPKVKSETESACILIGHKQPRSKAALCERRAWRDNIMMPFSLAKFSPSIERRAVVIQKMQIGLLPGSTWHAPSTKGLRKSTKCASFIHPLGFAPPLLRGGPLL